MKRMNIQEWIEVINEGKNSKSKKIDEGEERKGVYVRSHMQYPFLK